MLLCYFYFEMRAWLSTNTKILLRITILRYLPWAVFITPMLMGRASAWNKKFKLKLTGLRIPTDQRQASWLFTSVVEDLNSELLWTNPASGQGGTWTRRLRIESPAPNHLAKLPPPLRFVLRKSLDFTKVEKYSRHILLQLVCQGSYP